MSRWEAERIVCLTDETTETLYRLGEEQRIVDISCHKVRPPQARQEKPAVTGFLKASIEEILNLRPDLVLGFSDLQADIARELIQHGVEVHIFNQRDVAGILRMIRTVGSLIGCELEGLELIAELQREMECVRAEGQLRPNRPLVYFEEWHDPLISGIGWVSELIGIAGGEDCFAELAANTLARDRIIANADEVIRRAPDIVIASWCGKPFDKDVLLRRPGWEAIPAIQNDRVYELDSSVILQPGPASLTDGLQQLTEIVRG